MADSSSWILRRLAKAYPRARCGLHFRNPFELLISTLLSAQTTDESVNRVTAGLWKRYPDPESLAKAPLPSLERAFRPLGLFRVRARNAKACAARLLERHGGGVPGSLEELQALPGVGRKTARVVLGECFGIPGIVVDTHMARVSRRLGLSRASDPRAIEEELDAVVPEAERTRFSHRIITHGRRVCLARAPLCHACPLSLRCPSAESRSEA